MLTVAIKYCHLVMLFLLESTVVLSCDLGVLYELLQSVRSRIILEGVDGSRYLIR